MPGPREGPLSLHQDQGFTLLELLTVIIIIGLLAAIAIPVFLGQRVRGYDSAAKSDLRQLADLQEALLVEDGQYGPIAQLPDFRATEDVTVSVVRYDGLAGYCLSAQHRGSPTLWFWDSQSQGLQASGTPACPVTTGGVVGDTVTG